MTFNLNAICRCIFLGNIQLFSAMFYSLVGTVVWCCLLVINCPGPCASFHLKPTWSDKSSGGHALQKQQREPQRPICTWLLPSQNPNLRDVIWDVEGTGSRTWFFGVILQC